MTNILTDLDKRLIHLFRDEEEWTVIFMITGIHEYELADQVEAYLEEHPHPTAAEMSGFINSLCPEIVVED